MDDLEDFSLEDSPDTELSLTEIYNNLLLHGELILEIPADQELFLRKGLATVKSKLNAKLKASGLKPEPSVLSFHILPSSTEAVLTIQVLLAKRAGIKVLSIKLPGDL